MTILESAYSNEVSAQGQLVAGKLTHVAKQGEVNFSWEALEKFFVDGEERTTTHYRVEKGQEVLFEVEVGTTEHTLTENVIDGVEFGVTLSAVDKSLEVEDSIALAKDQVIRTLPSVPQNLVAESLVGAIQLKWDELDREGKNDTVTKFFVYRSTQEGTSYQKIGEVEVNKTTTFTDTDLQEDTTYHYVVTSASEF